jgi:hypothetical protein
VEKDHMRENFPLLPIFVANFRTGRGGIKIGDPKILSTGGFSIWKTTEAREALHLLVLSGTDLL